MTAPGTSVAADTAAPGVNRLKVLAAASLALCLIALSISSYMSWVAFTSSKIAGCGSGGVFDCSHVLTSKWSKALGLPVATWAAALYATMIGVLVVTWSKATQRDPAIRANAPWVLLTVTAVSAGGAALWFTGLQVFVLEHLCPWCLGAHACGLILCIAVLAAAPLTWATKLQCLAVGCLGCVGLMTVQIAAPEPVTYEIQESKPVTSEKDGETEVFSPALFDAPSDSSSGPEVFSSPDDLPPAAQPAPKAPQASPQSSMEVKQLQQTVSKQWATVQALAWMITSPSTMTMAQVGSQPAAKPQETTKQEPTANQDGAAKREGEQQPKAEPPKEKAPRLIQLGSANLSLDANRWPIIGSPQAKYIFVEMFDYTCPHCRNSQKAIHGVLEKYGDDLAIVALPVPLSRQCNNTVTNEHPDHREACEIARIAVAVWRTNPALYGKFHDWLFSQPTKMTAAVAKAEAERITGGAVTAELSNPVAGKFIAQHVELYRRVGAGPVPKMIFPRTSIVGEITSPKDLGAMIEKHAAQ